MQRTLWLDESYGVPQETAFYRLSTTIIGRSGGRCAISAAAYRAGERLENHFSGGVTDYTSLARRVERTGIYGPDDMPAQLRDRETLWNTVTAMETRKDAQLAREFLISLPHQLTADERIAAVEAFVHGELVAKGMVVDVAWHRPDTGAGNNDERNYHAHVMATLRQVGPDGFWPTKTRAWNSRSQLQKWREAWARHCNVVLECGGHAERLDHRSLDTQMLEAIANRDIERAIKLDRKAEPWIPRAAYENNKSPISRKPREHKWRVVKTNADKAYKRAEMLRDVSAKLRASRKRPKQPTPEIFRNLLSALPKGRGQGGRKIPREWLIEKLSEIYPLFAFEAWLYTRAALEEKLRQARRDQLKRHLQRRRGRPRVTSRYRRGRYRKRT